jgi:hypothetical protein
MQKIYLLALDYEKGLWDNIDHYATALHLNRDEIKNQYIMALEWAYEIFEPREVNEIVI